MKEVLVFWGSIGLVIYGGIKLYDSFDKLHFFVTDEQIEKIARDSADSKIANYMQYCKEVNKISRLDDNCPIFSADIKQLQSRIIDLELRQKAQSFQTQNWMNQHP